MLGEIEKRMAACHLELNQEKTRIVYCKDSNRTGSHEHERFDFLGFTFRHRRRERAGGAFRSFFPAVRTMPRKGYADDSEMEASSMERYTPDGHRTR